MTDLNVFALSLRKKVVGGKILLSRHLGERSIPFWRFNRCNGGPKYPECSFCRGPPRTGSWNL